MSMTSDYIDIYLGREEPARICKGNEILSPTPIREGLVLWHDFKGRKNTDVKRGIAEDLNGNGNDGTLMNFAYQEGSGYEEGLEFDGVDDYINCSSQPSLDITEELTLEATIHPKEVKTQDIISKGITFGGVQNYSIAIYSNGSLYFEVLSNRERKNLSHNVSSITGTTFTVQARAKRDIMELFINGSLVSSVPQTGILFDTVTSSLRISGTGVRAFSGGIFSTKVYRKYLNDEEIQHNYQMEKARWNL